MSFLVWVGPLVLLAVLWLVFARFWPRTSDGRTSRLNWHGDVEGRPTPLPLRLLLAAGLTTLGIGAFWSVRSVQTEGHVAIPGLVLGALGLVLMLAFRFLQEQR